MGATLITTGVRPCAIKVVMLCAYHLRRGWIRYPSCDPLPIMNMVMVMGAWYSSLCLRLLSLTFTPGTIMVWYTIEGAKVSGRVSLGPLPVMEGCLAEG